MILYVVLTTLPPERTTAGTNWAAVAVIILYEIVFAFGWLGTCWIYGPEIAPLKYRHVAGSLGAAGEWFSTWVMVFGGGESELLTQRYISRSLRTDPIDHRHRNQRGWPKDFRMASAVLLPCCSLRLFSLSRE